MEYNFRSIERYWQQHWKETDAYKVVNPAPAEEKQQKKFYVLDMFPYPSGAGLHVGHPLGYITSDIIARFKRLKGFKVLHPMGYDAFGLPAEQYAIEHGIHPALSTQQNIDNFRNQLDNIGFSFDWSREIKTSDASYYKWTQWIFLKLFKSFFNGNTHRAAPIDQLIAEFEKDGNEAHPFPNAALAEQVTDSLLFTAEEWNSYDEKKQQDILMQYRLAYCGYGEVNWCEALGTVLANDEVVNGLSERGGHPVTKKKLRQWYLRITAYAERLLQGLQTIAFSDAMKEMQSNWIGKSSGAEIDFQVNGTDEVLKVYTTRPDTLFGVDFMVVAPEHEIIQKIVSEDYEEQVNEYITYVKQRSERERMSEREITGCFTGATARHPFDYREIPIYISEYVLAGYGTGAIMAVPCGDERDFKFAKHFDIPITNIIGEAFNGEEANPTKNAELENSNFLTGMMMEDAVKIMLQEIDALQIGKAKINYKMRDAAFSRQRYWGEPVPIIWKNGIAIPLDENELPLLLPETNEIKPGKNGESPLANIPEWVNKGLETNTMPGYAGSSWYFLRYMDPENNEIFCEQRISDYWNQVDLYVGGTEHAVGHLLYSRMWTKVLHDLGYISFDEPFKKLLNQGMIQGSSRFIYRLQSDKNTYVSYNLLKENAVDALHVDVNLVDGLELNVEAFKKSKPEFAAAVFILEDGKYICGAEVEKMSKSKFNTVNPDDIVDRYGADTFRMYEMFLGPVEQSKPWDTKGIEGVHRFLKKLWRLFYDEQKGLIVSDESANAAELKILHRTIKKVEEDTTRFSFNTAVSTFMICINDLTDAKCHKKEVLQPLLILLAPFAPHIAEELWRATGKETSILDASYPELNESYLTEATKDYPVSVNGRFRTTINMDADVSQKEAEKIVLANDVIKKWIGEGRVKKVIFVKGKMINVVI